LPERRSGPGFLCLVAGEPAITPVDVAVDVVDLLNEPSDMAAWYALFGRYLFDYRGDLKLPMTLLIDARSRAHKIYPGIPDAATMRQDRPRMNEPDRRVLALPFPGKYYGEPSRNYFRHGAAFFGAGYPEQALPYLDEVLRRNDKNFKAQLAVGQIHLEAERPAEAKPHLEAALALNADSPAVWNNLGGLDMAAGDVRSAAEKFEKAISLDPTASFALVNAGQAWARVGDESKAEQRFRRALDLAPRDAEAADRLGLLLAQRGDYEEAKSLFQTATES
jgi:tetratricopeptide (TPR) repeat protein